jgi:hypothetical protein
VGANSAIYVSKTRAGLAKEIGEWAEGSSDAGPWVACSHEHLVTAVRFLVVQDRLRQLRAAVPTVDASSIESQVQRIRTSLGRVRNIKTKITTIRDGADCIEGEADALRADISGALAEIEDALKVARKGAEANARVGIDISSDQSLSIENRSCAHEDCSDSATKSLIPLPVNEGARVRIGLDSLQCTADS